jgi:hypothetical protein
VVVVGSKVRRSSKMREPPSDVNFCWPAIRLAGVGSLLQHHFLFGAHFTWFYRNRGDHPTKYCFRLASTCCHGIYLRGDSQFGCRSREPLVRPVGTEIHSASNSDFGHIAYSFQVSLMSSDDVCT